MSGTGNRQNCALDRSNVVLSILAGHREPLTNFGPVAGSIKVLCIHDAPPMHKEVSALVQKPHVITQINAIIALTGKIVFSNSLL